MPRGRRGRPRSTPAGRATPQAPVGTVAGESPSSSTQHSPSSILQHDSISHESQQQQLAPPVITTEQPPRCTQYPTSAPEGPPVAEVAPGWSPSNPDPEANGCNPVLRSVAQPPQSTTGRSRAADLQLWSSPATASYRESMAVTEKQLGHSSQHQSTAGSAPPSSPSRHPQAGQADDPTQVPHPSNLEATQLNGQPTATAKFASPQPQLSSFAQLVDPNEGTELKFIPSNLINGIKCTQLEKSDVEEEIRYWQSAVLCSVMGANPPFEVMRGFFKRIWANFEIDRILYVRKGVFLVRFAQIQDKLAVEKRGIYFFDSKPMLVKGWNPSMDLQTESIQSLPVWV